MFLWNTDAEEPAYRNTIGDVRFSLTNTSYTLREKEKGYLRLKLMYFGRLEQLQWSPTTGDWTMLWTAPSEFCDIYGRINRKCGANSLCGPELGKDMEVHKVLSCTCFDGFKPRYPVGWWFRDMRDGCIRKTDLACIGNGFQRLFSVKVAGHKRGDCGEEH